MTRAHSTCKGLEAAEGRVGRPAPASPEPAPARPVVAAAGRLAGRGRLMGRPPRSGELSRPAALMCGRPARRQLVPPRRPRAPIDTHQAAGGREPPPRPSAPRPGRLRRPRRDPAPPPPPPPVPARDRPAQPRAPRPPGFGGRTPGFAIGIPPSPGPRPPPVDYVEPGNPQKGRGAGGQCVL